MKDAEAKQQIHRTRCDSRARMTLARKRVPFSIRDYLTAVEKDGEKKRIKEKGSEEKGKNRETRRERQAGVKKKNENTVKQKRPAGRHDSENTPLSFLLP